VHSRKAILAFCRLAHQTVQCGFLSFFGEADRWRTRHCPVHTGQSGAPFRPLARPRVSLGSRGRPLARPTVGSSDSSMHHRTVR
jgi:hypothetical protein